METFRARTEPLEKGGWGYVPAPLYGPSVPLNYVAPVEAQCWGLPLSSLPRGSSPSVLARMGSIIIIYDPLPLRPKRTTGSVKIDR